MSVLSQGYVNNPDQTRLKHSDWTLSVNSKLMELADFGILNEDL